MFDGPGTPGSQTSPANTRENRSIDGPWKVSFPANLGAPPQAEFTALASWTRNRTPASVTSPERQCTPADRCAAGMVWPGAEVILDLGAVKEIAEVEVNGKAIGGILWKPPFIVDVTPALKPGSNDVRSKSPTFGPIA